MRIVVKSIISIIAAVFLSFNVLAQDKGLSDKKQESKVQTAKFEVKGVCKMCKERIENAAYIKGVKWVEWNKVTDTLTVIYRVDKSKLIDIHNAIAEAGHTTDLVECKLEAYNKLPACCEYNGDAKKH